MSCSFLNRTSSQPGSSTCPLPRRPLPWTSPWPRMVARASHQDHSAFVSKQIAPSERPTRLWEWAHRGVLDNSSSSPSATAWALRDADDSMFTGHCSRKRSFGLDVCFRSIFVSFRHALIVNNPPTPDLLSMKLLTCESLLHMLQRITPHRKAPLAWMLGQSDSHRCVSPETGPPLVDLVDSHSDVGA